MQPSLFLLGLLARLVSAHGKITVVTGNAGGNGTALGIQGGVIPSEGNSGKAQSDTTIFSSTKLLSAGLGKTTGSGKNTISMLVDAMALSGPILPQITPGGSLSGTWRIVTADGAGPIGAVIDPTAKGNFTTGIPLTVVQQVPGYKGNFIFPEDQKVEEKRSIFRRAMDAASSVVLSKRAARTVQQDFAFEFAVPANVTCNGVIAGLRGVCLVKIANAHKAGPFGGVVAVQMATASEGAKCSREFRA